MRTPNGIAIEEKTLEITLLELWFTRWSLDLAASTVST